MVKLARINGQLLPFDCLVQILRAVPCSNLKWNSKYGCVFEFGIGINMKGVGARQAKFGLELSCANIVMEQLRA